MNTGYLAIRFKFHFEHLYVGLILVCGTGIWLHAIGPPGPVLLEPV
jgi:hypothetical protein